MNESLPLLGVRVVDVTNNVAGPFASVILADLGADVVKVESRRGDDARRMAPTSGDTAAFFAVLNRNKHSVVAGLWLALGILAALRRRDVTGVGGSVDTSLLEVGATYLSYHVAAHQLTGATDFRSGSEHPAFAPSGVFTTANGRLAVGVGSDEQFARFCEAIGGTELRRDARFATNESRVANRAALRDAIELVLATANTDHWVGALTRGGVAADRVAGVVDVLSDEQLAVNGCWLDVEAAGMSLRVPGLPLRFDGRRPPVRCSAPPYPEAGR
jgi:crotonobetainyl-CoA:carnitine CoA-transferase CaiB-like acyl-CoA transferase